MVQQVPVELVAPTQIVNRDVIEDPLGHRWLNVRGVRILTGPTVEAVGGAYSFYGEPGDQVASEGHEQVKRRQR